MALPDVARQCPSNGASAHTLPSASLDWVGMSGIDVPLCWQDVGTTHRVTAQADVHVNLPRADVRGIHMSRLYALLTALGEQSALSPRDVLAVLHQALDSHADCGSTAARVRLRLRFDVLTQRPGLLSTHLTGWRRYPVTLEATLLDGTAQMSMACTVTYSSTCPCSAALSRQALTDAFSEAFGHQAQVSVGEAMAWLNQHGSLATPHSQRSHATITLPLAPHADHLSLMQWVDLAEAALGTPVQTAVKRVDEQAFARLNGSNLMYVEDALRRLHLALLQAGAPDGSHIEVAHLESLHPHDAVASTILRR
jgi:GTP cyclohydrolase IB